MCGFRLMVAGAASMVDRASLDSVVKLQLTPLGQIMRQGVVAAHGTYVGCELAERCLTQRQ
jgi:hypothetical protein